MTAFTISAALSYVCAVLMSLSQSVISLISVLLYCRANADKDGVEMKVRFADKRGTEPQIKAMSVGGVGAAAPPTGGAQTHSVHELKTRINELEDEV